MSDRVARLKESIGHEMEVAAEQSGEDYHIAHYCTIIWNVVDGICGECDLEDGETRARLLHAMEQAEALPLMQDTLEDCRMLLWPKGRPSRVDVATAMPQDLPTLEKAFAHALEGFPTIFRHLYLQERLGRAVKALFDASSTVQAHGRSELEHVLDQFAAVLAQKPWAEPVDRQWYQRLRQLFVREEVLRRKQID